MRGMRKYSHPRFFYRKNSNKELEFCVCTILRSQDLLNNKKLGNYL